MGDLSVMGTLPACVEIDPPIPVDLSIIPHTRGVYLVDFDLVLTESDQRLWLVDSSAESLRHRDGRAWEMDRYGMPLQVRLQTGICKGMSPEDAEERLHRLTVAKNVYLADYILAITRGRGRGVAREVAIMQQARQDKDLIALLAACWRLSPYEGKNDRVVKDNIKRIMVSLGAVQDAVLV